MHKALKQNAHLVEVEVLQEVVQMTDAQIGSCPNTQTGTTFLLELKRAVVSIYLRGKIHLHHVIF
jgi:hypothetical protein